MFRHSKSIKGLRSLEMIVKLAVFCLLAGAVFSAGPGRRNPPCFPNCRQGDSVKWVYCNDQWIKVSVSVYKYFSFPDNKKIFRSLKKLARLFLLTKNSYKLESAMLGMKIRPFSRCFLVLKLGCGLLVVELSLGIHAT